MKSARERMDVISAYREVGSYRGAAAMCGTTPKTVRRIIERHESGGGRPPRARRARNYDSVAELVADRVKVTGGRISAKRLLPVARAAGYDGSPRNFRRLVAGAKADWRAGHHRGRRPAVWTPGEVLAIDWGTLGVLHVFCAVLAWSRVRFVRFADDERAATTFALLAECFDVLGGVPKVVLADRMGLLEPVAWKAGTAGSETKLEVTGRGRGNASPLPDERWFAELQRRRLDRGSSAPSTS